MKFLASIFCTLFLTYTNAQDLELELFATNLDRPVNIKQAGDDRLFVVEQDGYISIINNDGTVNNTPFLDIDDRVVNIGGIGDERGLLGLAFHPNYATNGYFYVNYINNSNNTVISRFTRDSANSDLADATSELIILSYTQPFVNHNGGDLAFGEDGYLYISSGDGGSGGDPQNNAQTRINLLGKLLRIDIDVTNGSDNYAIPSDNPYVGHPIFREEIWAYGLRNPWKFSFDKMNGDIWIGDVGQGQNEEINHASSSEAGLNYGWKCYEGNDAFDTTNCPSPSALTFPVAQYNHFTDGEFKCSITGGYRYRGATYPNFEGLYFFADFCSEEIGYIAENNGTWDMTLKDFSGDWTAFGEDINGELYIADISSGNIYKLTDASLSTDEFRISQISIYPNPTNDQLNIDLSTSAEGIKTKISIIDLHGKIIKTITNENSSIIKLNTLGLTSGIYILKIETNNGEQDTRKLVIN